MNEIELRECPFCGCKARQYEGETHNFGVTCTKCTCHIYGYASKGAAKRAWNRRTTDAKQIALCLKR